MRTEDEIIIVGAGPVGLMLANLLGLCRTPCLLVDRRTKLPEQSRAIGITPPSLSLLDSIGCANALIERGVPVRDAIVWDGRRKLGSVTFRNLPGNHRLILSVPQRETMRVLESRLRDWECVRYENGVEFIGLASGGSRPSVRLKETRCSREWIAQPALLIGCDGHRSAVRSSFGIGYDHKYYRASFSMADFEDEPAMGPEAHLFFTDRGAVESFPLPGGLRRWIVQTGNGRDRLNLADLVDCVRGRTGVDLDGAESSDVSWFRPERLCCDRFCKGPVLLCGDAAHVMSPIGGQGMNTGFGDAQLAAHIISRYRSREPWPEQCSAYDHRRHRAFRFSADRAALGMWIGTRRGSLSRFRTLLLRDFLLHGPFAGYLSRHFAMLTVPHGSLALPNTTTIGGAWEGR